LYFSFGILYTAANDLALSV